MKIQDAYFMTRIWNPIGWCVKSVQYAPDVNASFGDSDKQNFSAGAVLFPCERHTLLDTVFHKSLPLGYAHPAKIVTLENGKVFIL